MARAKKPIELSVGARTKEEIESRKKAEALLKSSSDEVYKVPKHLTKEVQVIYKNLVDKLKPLDVLTDLDIETLCVTSNALWHMTKALDHIESTGQVITIRDENGDVLKVSKNPSVDVYKNFEAIYRINSSNLCLNPSARAKLASEMANLLKQQETQEEQSQSDREIAWLCGMADSF